MFNQTISFAPQGWECPKCKRVYSPSTMMCIHCVPNPILPTTSGTSTAEYPIPNSSVSYTDAKISGTLFATDESREYVEKQKNKKWKKNL